MTERSVQHATFVIERTFAAPPARVFHAFADPAAKARWFVGPGEWSRGGHAFDFRVGGRERGTRELLDNLDAELRREPATA